MPRRKIIALALLAAIIATIGILAQHGAIRSSEFWAGMMMGLILTLIVAAVIGIPKWRRSRK
ncbi:MAG: hypothetical protein B7Y45_04365 [Sphingomonas sp. 28-66-16]|nr:MAG: hypothetical protein B7Y45_04365 [Sphingomonas sp. 28-66-16]